MRSERFSRLRHFETEITSKDYLISKDPHKSSKGLYLLELFERVIPSELFWG